jgi:Ser/Thr protein kinase RdoA (MazF antagonist)
VRTAEIEFGRRVCAAYGLGQDGIALTAMTGSSTRLWELRTPAGRFVVKEFCYDTQDRSATLAVSAEFEYDIWQSKALLVPEPVRAVDGRLIVRLPGLREQELTVRVHRWLDGRAVPVPASRGVAAAAGESLAAIQQAGLTVGAQPCGSLRWWAWDLYQVLGRLTDAALLRPGQSDEVSGLLPQALAVVAAGERLPGGWGYTHSDHKPENSLLVADRIAVLDWDECGYNHPRLEAVESALRWAGANDGEPDPAAFRQFMRGYESRAGRLGLLAPADFAKWVAAVVGWFTFSGARALGAFDDTEAELAEAAEMVVWSGEMLRRTMASLPRWAAELPEP